MDSGRHFWHVILRVTGPALTASPWHRLLQPYCSPDVSPSVHAAHMQWETHSTRETPLLTPCCSNRPCRGRREKRFGVSRRGVLLAATRGRLSTTHVRWHGRTGCESSVVLWTAEVKRPPPPSYEWCPSPVQGTWARGQAPLSLWGCTAPTAPGISPPTQAGISSTFPGMLGRATAGVGVAGGWQDPAGHKAPWAGVGSPWGPSPPGSLGQGEAGGGGR